MELKEKSFLIKLAAKALNVLFWSQIVAGVLLVGMAAITARERGGFAIQVPVTFSEATLKKVQPTLSNFPIAILNADNGILSIHADATFRNMVLMSFGYGIVYIAVLLVIYQLERVFKSFSNSEMFKSDNVKRMNMISMIFIVGNIVQCAFLYYKNYFLTSKLDLGNLNLTYKFDFSLLLIGVSLYICARIINMGHMLEEEQKFTV